MTTARDSVTELYAIAAMPGLEALSESIAHQMNTDPELVLQQVLFTAWQWPGGSQNKLSQMLQHPEIWNGIVSSAARVGRKLPAKPPSKDTRSQFLTRHRSIGAVAAKAFPSAMQPLVQSAGLLVESTPCWHRPARENTVYGDGTVFLPPSEVKFDLDTGMVIGSRSKHDSPRVVERFHGKKAQDAEGRPGFPICVIGVHGGVRYQRALLALDSYVDRNEVGAALRLFDDARGVYGSTIHALAYDGLMNGIHLQRVMRAGVIPIVPMRAAAEGTGLPVPDYLQAPLGVPSKTTPKLKKEAVCEYLHTVEIPVGSRMCRHHLWWLDATLLACDDHEIKASWSTPVCEQVSIDVVRRPRGDFDVIGRYRIPCRHAHPIVEINHSGDREGSRGSTRSLADWSRPLDLTNRVDLTGVRQDVESTFTTAKRRMALKGRSASYKIDNFAFDMVGFALLTNSALWDVHVAQHTITGQKIARELDRAALRAATRRR